MSLVVTAPKRLDTMEQKRDQKQAGFDLVKTFSLEKNVDNI